MAEDLTGGALDAPLFNSALETGIRSAVVLDATYPRQFDLAHLTWFDHLVVHTHDIGGPKSLHPDTGELLVRRRLVEDGLKLMRQLHLVDSTTTEFGILYQAREEASALIDSMRSKYARELKQRADWLASFLMRMSDEDLRDLIIKRIGRWTVEFQGGIDGQNVARDFS
jgi:ABC-3C biological conflict system middle component